MAGSSWKRLTVVTSVLAAASIVGITTASATRIVKIPSQITIKSHGLKFSGKVTSSKAPCVSGRKVTLYRTNGNVLGHATTSATGHWSVTASGSAGITLGHFYAKVKQRSDGTAGTIYVCKAATSKTIAFHEP